MLKKIVIISAGVCLASLPLSYLGFTGDSEYDRATLRDLQGVRVVTDVEPDAPHVLTDEQLQTTVELKLRTVGIKVVTVNDSIPGSPILIVVVNVTRPLGANAYAYAISARLTQTVVLTRNSSILADVPTWSSEVFGQVDESDLHMIRVNMEGMVDEFANAFLSVNPR